MARAKSTKTKEAETNDILVIALEEQRRMHDELTSSFGSMRSKIITYIGALLAIMTFLYTPFNGEDKSLKELLFIPDQPYGMIFYFGGLFFVLYALVNLVRGARPDATWDYPSTTIEETALRKVNSEMTKTEFLQRLVDEFEDSTLKNMKTHEQKSEAIKQSFFPMLLGVIILIVLRFFS